MKHPDYYLAAGESLRIVHAHNAKRTASDKARREYALSTGATALFGTDHTIMGLQFEDGTDLPDGLRYDADRPNVAVPNLRTKAGKRIADELHALRGVDSWTLGAAMGFGDHGASCGVEVLGSDWVLTTSRFVPPDAVRLDRSEYWRRVEMKAAIDEAVRLATKKQFDGIMEVVREHAGLEKYGVSAENALNELAREFERKAPSE